MARKRKYRTRRKAKRSLRSSSYIPKRRAVQRTAVKRSFETKYQTPRRVVRKVKRLKNTLRPKNRQLEALKTSIVHKTPIKHYVCARRKIRREVLHALKKTGQAGQKKPEYKNRNIKC